METATQMLILAYIFLAAFNIIFLFIIHLNKIIAFFKNKKKK